MSNGDLNKTLSDVLSKMDKRTLQENLSKAVDMLKSSNTQDLAKQIGSVCSNQQGTLPGSSDNSALEKLNIDPEVLKKLGSTDLEKFLKYIGSHGDEIKDKLKDVVK